MAEPQRGSPLLRLPRELRDQIYRAVYTNLDPRKALHVYMYRSRHADHPRGNNLKTCLGLIHSTQQLRREALPELLTRLQLTLHPAPASSLKIFSNYFDEWIPHVRMLCIADADVFLEDRASQTVNALEVLLSSIARQSGGSLRELSISLPRADWNNLAGCSNELVLSLRLFHEVLKLRGLESFLICKPPDRIDRPRWGRKPSWDVVARHMSEQKWKIVEEKVASVVTKKVGDG